MTTPIKVRQVTEQLNALQTKSPPAEQLSPVSRALLGHRGKRASNKEKAKLLFMNGKNLSRERLAPVKTPPCDEQQATTNNNVNGSRTKDNNNKDKASSNTMTNKPNNKALFVPYKSPSDTMMSPATRKIMGKTRRARFNDVENDVPAFLLRSSSADGPAKTQHKQRQQPLRVMSLKKSVDSKKMNTTKSLTPIQALAPRSVNVGRHSD